MSEHKYTFGLHHLLQISNELARSIAKRPHFDYKRSRGIVNRMPRNPDGTVTFSIRTQEAKR